MNSRILILLFSFTLLGVTALAKDDPKGPIDEATVRSLLARQGFNQTDSNQIIESLAGKNGRVALSGALFTSGGNGAFFIDNNNWNFDGAIMQNGHLASIHNMFDVYFWNGGINIELSYKWIWLFLPTNTSIDNLDGETFGGPVFGRGLSLKTNVISGSPVFVQGGWVKNSRTGDSIYILAAGVDALSLAGGLSAKVQINNLKLHAAAGHFFKFVPTFPKLYFKQKQVAK